MKRVLLFMIFFAAIATAQAQHTSYSGSEHYLYSKKLYAKIWMQADPGNLKSRSESVDENTGERTVIIYRQDSAKIYTLKPEKKTYIVIPMSQVTNMNSLLGIEFETHRTVDREFIGLETVNGYECHHYKHTSTSTFSHGGEEVGVFHSWIYQPLNVQMQHSNGGYDEPIFLNNFQQGPQPAHLFEIPKDYEGFTVPAGGLNEMIKNETGTSLEDMKDIFDVFKEKSKEQQEKINKVEKDSSKTEQEKIIEYLKMLEGVSKKK